ncbi:hypothetical protein [Streptomyces sp. NBC_01264]|uniref:hypothetical protein n=1 Tax=Streptomyces sp. NBC_01264 TaxID=2903804 RepID=UPI002254E155|nr:hypothetical protein [Streptomyces sp. NBC_01264]MCX4783669.1 hypothetical protein [Streptomyces sp. NBC_01264]
MDSRGIRKVVDVPALEAPGDEPASGAAGLGPLPPFQPQFQRFFLALLGIDEDE